MRPHLTIAGLQSCSAEMKHSSLLLVPTIVERTRESMMRRSILLNTLAASLTLLLSTTAMVQAAPSGVLKIAVGADPETFDPHFNDLPTGNTVDLHVFEGLFRLDAENNVIKELATDYSYSDDGKVFTVKIEKGRKFGNGDPLNAQAVAASFSRLLDPKV